MRAHVVRREALAMLIVPWPARQARQNFEPGCVIIARRSEAAVRTQKTPAVLYYIACATVEVSVDVIKC